MMIRPIKTGKIAEGVYAVRSAISNFYIIDAGSTLIAFDTGIIPGLSRRGMESLGLDPKKVSHVFLTHSDYDHAGGLSAFSGARVFISKAEEPMVTGKKPRMLIKYNKKLTGYTALSDGETVNINSVSVKIIVSPGHTVGSACYLVNDILVTGDTLRVSSDGQSITPFLFFQNMNHAELKRSLKKLHDDGIIGRASMILTGHTGVMKK